MENEEILQEEESSIISLTDENGVETEFEYLDCIEYEGKEYLVPIMQPPKPFSAAASMMVWETMPTSVRKRVSGPMVVSVQTMMYAVGR